MIVVVFDVVPRYLYARLEDAFVVTFSFLRLQSVRADMNGDEVEVVHHEPKPSSGGHGHGDGPVR